MPKAPDFTAKKVLTIASRACHICSNPHCSTLTVGPSDGRGDLAIKVGEAAHIEAARAGEARHNPNMNDAQRARVSNGIWLCANCHTMVDKNLGADFPTTLLQQWKRHHEATIKSLLHSHRSPLPLLRQFTAEGAVAQNVVDMIAQHGATFVDMSFEDPGHVVISVERMREEIKRAITSVKYDLRLKTLLRDAASACREYMNDNSRDQAYWHRFLETFRVKIGRFVRVMRDDFGCTVHGDLNRIIS